MRLASFSGVLVLACLPLLHGCEVMRPNAGRLFAIESAGYAGRFRLAYDRWPALGELEEFMVIETAVFDCRGGDGYRGGAGL